MSTFQKSCAAAAALLLACSVTAVAHAEPTPEPSGPAPGPAAENPESAKPAAAGPKTSFEGDGLYQVGTDIVPGTYTSAGPVEGGTCYWKRSNGDEMLDNAMTKKPAVVTIEAGDTTFKTSECQTWTLDNSASPAPGANPLDILGQLGRVFANRPPG